MFKLTRVEWWVGVYPGALALFIALVFFGGPDNGMGVFSHPLVAILTFPGFVALEIGRFLLRRGNPSGDAWDILSAPLSMIITIGALRFLTYLRRVL